MLFPIRCPACRARQDLTWPSEQGVSCRRCDADLSLLADTTAKIQDLRRRLKIASSPDESERLQSELSLWDPNGRVQ